MPYYGAGDYYRGRGDYYRGRGDPGIWDFLKKAGGAAVRIGAAAVGIPLPARPAGPSGTSISIQPPQIGGVRLGPSIQVERYQGVRGSVDVPAADGACPRGFHLNKGRGRNGEPPGSYCVRNRSMNVTNPRALRRAIRREDGFIQLAKRFNLRPPPRQRAGSGLKSKRRK